MKRNRLLCVTMVVVLLMVSLSACGGAGGLEVMEDMPEAEMGYDNGIYESATSAAGEAEVEDTALQNQKLIRTISLEAETDDLDATLALIDAKVSALGGYMEDKSVRDNSNASYSRRYADMTIRIPVAELDGFVDHVAGATNITSEKETAENVTLKYVATQSRVTALETEQERLLELLGKAETMSDLLEIESRLTDVRTELEQVASQLRLYDNLVDYGTINLSVSEVKEFTVTEPEEPTYWERISDTFVESWKGLGTLLQELSILAVACIPYLLMLVVPGVAVLIVVLIIVKAVRRKRRK